MLPILVRELEREHKRSGFLNQKSKFTKMGYCNFVSGHDIEQISSLMWL